MINKDMSYSTHTHTCINTQKDGITDFEKEWENTEEET
jgi:hypothetical protein